MSGGLTTHWNGRANRQPLINHGARAPFNSGVMPQPIMNEQEQFIRRHKDSEFHYKDELFAGLSSGACFLKRGPAERQASLPCSHFLIIYRHRAEHLQRFDTPHARRVREDIIAFCDELAKTPDELCLLWMFSMPPNREYMVFEGAESGRVLGCILVANKLLTPPDEWERLWQGESDSV